VERIARRQNVRRCQLALIATEILKLTPVTEEGKEMTSMNQSIDELTKQDVESWVNDLDQTVKLHPSMVEESNPVLVALKEGRMRETQAEAVLRQYSRLPALIVDFLSKGKTRLHSWTDTERELERNIGEETGSRTGGISHYEILKVGLQEELRLNLNQLTETDPTKHFLELIREGLSSKPEPFVAGLIYALEASAVPELTVVAEIVNHCASLKSMPKPISWARVMHLYVFEVGHKNGLVEALINDIKSVDDLHQLSKGFDYMLDAMDSWWASLALVPS
jgi:hypothetical protein